MGMNSCGKTQKRQDGSVLVIVMIVLALLTIIGVSATDMATTEIKIAGNDKEHKIAFYQVESGVYGLAKWVGLVLEDNAIPTEADELGTGEEKRHRFEYLDSTEEALMDEVMKYDNAYDAANDVEFSVENNTVGVDLRRLKARQMAGGAAEFGTGASGVGEKTAVEIPYWFASETTTGSGAQAAVTAKYIKLLGIPGGL